MVAEYIPNLGQCFNVNNENNLSQEMPVGEDTTLCIKNLWYLLKCHNSVNGNYSHEKPFIIMLFLIITILKKVNVQREENGLINFIVVKRILNDGLQRFLSDITI